MSLPIPFQVSRQIGNNLSSAFSKVKDENAIEQILSESMQSGDPAQLQQSIGKILSQVSPERQGAAVQYLEKSYNNVKSKLDRERRSTAAIQSGINPDLPESLQKMQYENNLQNQTSQNIFGGNNAFSPSPKYAPYGHPLNFQQENAGEMGGVGQTQPPQPSSAPLADPSGKGWKDLSEEQLIQLRGVKGFEKQADSELKRRQEEAKRPKPGDEFSKIREKAVTEYVNSAIRQGEEAETLNLTLDVAERAINGEITGPGALAIAKNNPYGQLWLGLTPDEAILQAANKNLLGTSKGIFGSKPTEREIFLLLNTMFPSIGKTKEANLAGLRFIRKFNEIKLNHSKFTEQLSEGGTKYVPNLEQQVNQMMKPLVQAFHAELAEAAVEIYGATPQKPAAAKDKQMEVTAPDGSRWNMTQEQIDAASKQGVKFEPLKK